MDLHSHEYDHLTDGGDAYHARSLYGHHAFQPYAHILFYEHAYGPCDDYGDVHDEHDQNAYYVSPQICDYAFYYRLLVVRH